MQWKIPSLGLTGKRHPRTAGGQAVQDFNRSLLLIVDPDSLQASIAARISELFGPDRIIIFQLEQQRASFAPTYSSGFGAEDLNKCFLRRHGRLARWLLVNEACLVLPRATGVCDYLSEEEREVLNGLRIRVCVPLISLNRLTGIIMLGSTNPEWGISSEDLGLLEILAGQAGLAFENAYLYQEQRERLRRIYRAERLAAAGQLAAGVAHEVRNPLTAIRSTIQYAIGDYQESDPKRTLLQELLTEVDRIDKTVDGLLSLTRLGDYVPQPVDVVDVLEQSLMLVSAQAQRQDTTLVHPYAKQPLKIMGDAGQMKQVFLNLLLNALQAVSPKGRIEASVSEWHSDMSPVAGRWARVMLSDDGAGIPAEQLDQVFDPFFTTKRDGTGLGLSVCHGIIHQHEGEIDIKSELGKGTMVSVRLPLI